ncbi:MAG: hypothetical protein J5585_02330 [Clostridia bacterium]|nr:hypothetical protein [Clostridia bacterium]
MKNTIKIITSAAALLIAASLLCGCGIFRKTDEALIKAGLECAGVMREAVLNETYRKLTSAQVDGEILQTVTDMDVSRAAAVYELKFDPEELIRSQLNDSSGEYDQLPEALKKKMINSMYSSVPALVNSQTGFGAVSFMSMFTGSADVERNGPKEVRSLVFVFESGYPVYAVFYPGQNGRATCTGFWLMIDSQSITSPETLLGQLMITGDQIEAVRLK